MKASPAAVQSYAPTSGRSPSSRSDTKMPWSITTFVSCVSALDVSSTLMPSEASCVQADQSIPPLAAAPTRPLGVPRPRDDPGLTATARESEPRAVLVLQQDGGASPAVDDQPGDDGAGRRHPPGAGQRPPGGRPPGDDDIATRKEDDARPAVARNGEKAAARGRGDDFGLSGRGENGKHEAGGNPDPRQLDITPLCVHSPGSVPEAAERRAGRLDVGSPA